MSVNAQTDVRHEEQEYATFYIGESLIGIDIRRIQEINRQTKCTQVMHAPTMVRGVMNLRGQVVTVLDLRIVLGSDNITEEPHNRTIVVSSGSEAVGLLVDRVADVVRVTGDAIEQTPCNLSGVDTRFFRGMVKLQDRLLLLLNEGKALEMEEAAA